jgi:hypothetical protein
MNQDDQLPPHPPPIKPQNFDADLSHLPPLSPRSEGLNGYGEISDLSSDAMERSSLAEFFEALKPRSTWSILQITIAVLILSFVSSVLFTSAILAGFIEIHPAAIKSFLRTLVGKS